MAGANYDGIAGFLRVREAGEAFDTFAVEVLAYHGAIESELERVISGLVVRSEGLFTASPKLSFGHKVNLLRAVWQGDAAKSDKICAVLMRFNDLRNAVAHNDPGQIKGCVAGLTNAYREFDTEVGDEAKVADVAEFVCFFFDDNKDVKAAFETMITSLNNLVNTKLPEVLGNKG